MKVRDINNTEIKVGDTVTKYAVMFDENSKHEQRVVKALAPMHENGEYMVWFVGGGGAHHPKACAVVRGGDK